MKKKRSISKKNARSAPSTAVRRSENENVCSVALRKFPVRNEIAIGLVLVVGAVMILWRVVQKSEIVNVDIATDNDDSCNDTNTNDETCLLTNDAIDNNASRVSEDCTLVMAPSGIPNSGWGVFTLTPREPGQPILDQGDIVIHIADPNPHKAHGMKRLVWDYVWDGQETGGHYEGMHVTSAISGFGSLANGLSEGAALIRGMPSVDDAGLIRGYSPGAGAASHHHDLLWQANRDLSAGDELYIEYGAGWFEERGFESELPHQKRDVSFLRDVGYCLDNIVPGPSLIEDAGRGAFANRNLVESAVVAPVPLIPLSRSSLELFMKRQEDDSLLVATQLLLNYCFGHTNSSLLLYRYSHGINYINHHSSPNVQLRWGAGSDAFFEKPLSYLQQSSTSQLMMELVATRSIRKGEEVVLDYGHDWVKAWESHVESWQSRDKGIYHISAETMNKDDKYFTLRTQQEQKSNPYPSDVFTSCYYRYSDYAKENAPVPLDSTPVRSIAKWKQDMMRSRNLRPCIFIERESLTILNGHKTDESSHYTVHVVNRPRLDEMERIPKGHIHFALHVPRHAIVFSDMIYTSDQHLENAFREEIGLGDLFPHQWKDLL